MIKSSLLVWLKVERKKGKREVMLGNDQKKESSQGRRSKSIVLCSTIGGSDSAGLESSVNKEEGELPTV